MVSAPPTPRGASAAHMLDEIGFVVVEASSGLAALAIDRLPALKLLVTDHMMPEMDGAELVRRAQLIRPNLPFLIISGYANVEGIAPDLPRLTKPFKIHEHREALSQLALVESETVEDLGKSRLVTTEKPHDADAAVVLHGCRLQLLCQLDFLSSYLAPAASITKQVSRHSIPTIELCLDI